MDQRKRLDLYPRQNSQPSFRNAYIAVSGTMFFCDLLLLIALLWRHPSLSQTQVFVLLIVSGAALLPLFLGAVAHSARISSFLRERRKDRPKCK